MTVGALNQTVVTTALPRIASDLGGLENMSWVFTSFMVTSAATLPIFGKLSDTHGRRRFFVGGIVVLLIGSVLAGMSQSVTQLAIYRGVQGVGSAALLANSMAIIGELFPPSQLGKWRAINQAVMTLAAAAGPLAGGFISDHLSWQWVFYLNVPVGIIAIAVAAFVMPPFRDRHIQHRVDYLGSAMLLAAISPLLVGFAWAGQQYAWSSWQVLGAFGVSAIALAAFILVERRAEEPILPMTMFRSPIFSVSSMAFFLIGMGLFGSLVYLPLFAQAVQGKSATISGLLLTPMMLASFATGFIGGHILTKWGRYRLLAMFCTGTASLGMFLLSRLGIDSSSYVMALDMAIVGIGIGIAMPLFVIVVQNAVPQQMVGVAVTSTAFVRSLGASIGVALMGTVVNKQFVSGLQTGVPDSARQAVAQAGVVLPTTPQPLLDPELMSSLEAALAPSGPEAFGQVASAMQMSLVSAIDAAFLLSAVALAAACIFTFFLKEIPLRSTR